MLEAQIYFKNILKHEKNTLSRGWGYRLSTGNLYPPPGGVVKISL